MKVISSKIHGVVDYVSGIALLAAPNLFGFNDLGGPAVTIPRVLGVLILLQSIMTDYELGLVKVIPFKIHLLVDYVASAFLALSPFLFGFSDEAPNVWLPHVIVGIAYFVITLLTNDNVGERSQI